MIIGEKTTAGISNKIGRLQHIKNLFLSIKWPSKFVEISVAEIGVQLDDKKTHSFYVSLFLKQTVQTKSRREVDEEKQAL